MTRADYAARLFPLCAAVCACAGALGCGAVAIGAAMVAVACCIIGASS